MPIKVRENNTWVEVSSANGANGVNGLDGVVGNVLQVKYRESNAVVTIAQQDVYPIFGLGVNISPIKTTTKLLLEANIMSNAYYVSSFGFALLQGLTWSDIGGNANTNSANAIATLFSFGDYNSGLQSNLRPGVTLDYVAANMYSVTYRYLYTQSGLTPVGGLTFAPTACSSWANSLYTLTINNREFFNRDMLSTSSITVTEIEV
jgi:hypothetical protein